MKKNFFRSIGLILALWSTIHAANPLISMLVPVQDTHDDIAGFISDMHKQSMAADTEIIFLNTTASDPVKETLAMLQKQYPTIRIVHMDFNLSITGVWNLGLHHIRGTYVLIADINDRFDYQALRQLSAELDANTAIDLVYADYYETNARVASFEEGKKYGSLVELPAYDVSSLAKEAPGVVALWRTSAHSKYGFFRQDIQECGRWEFANRIASRGAQLKKCSGALAIRYVDHEKKIQGHAQRTKEIEQITHDYNPFWRGEKEIIEEKPMVIVIPSYNNAACCLRNIFSVLTQKYTNYRIIYINDGSTDQTGQLVEQYVKEHNQQHRVTIIHNTQRLGAGANKYRAAQMCKDDEIYCDLDGDDWFAHEHVLSHINELYADPNVWVTYGQFIYYPKGMPGWAGKLQDSIIERNQVRYNDWLTTALRTFYAGLFKRVAPDYLKIDGQFVTTASDLAFMFCVIEMAGKHSRFVPEILYVYNINTTQNDGTIDRSGQIETGMKLRSKRPYAPIDDYHTVKKTVYITKGLWGDLFDINNKVANRDDCLQPTYLMRERLKSLGYEVAQVDSLQSLDSSASCIICFEPPTEQEMAYIASCPQKKRILFLWEPPSVWAHAYNHNIHERGYVPQLHEPFFDRIYTWCDALVDNKKYFKFHYPIWRPMERVIDYNQKQFCVMVACNKYSPHPQELYSQRRSIIDFFDKGHPDEFDLYGRGWDPGQYQTYKGAIERKIDYIKHYKFNICYENIRDIPGYITEKIFDAMRVGTVPVYWGASNIEEYVPKNCFIDRRNFDSNQALYEYLKSITQEQYQQYIANIMQFMASTQAKRFSIDHFVQLMANVVTAAEVSATSASTIGNSKLYFATAADASYFNVLINMIGSLHKTNYERLGEIAVYDLGMTNEQKKILENIEKVVVCPIELTHPDLIKPMNTRTWGKPVPGWYAWKPVIIKQALERYPYVFYTDAGTTFYQPLDDLLEHLHKNGYFLHNGADWTLQRQTTHYVRKKFNLETKESAWVLNLCGMEANFIGMTRTMAPLLIMPLYEMTKYDFNAYADDGTCPGGFGNCRHDQTLFSLFALSNKLYIYHHYQNPRENFYIDAAQGEKPFHIACNAEDRTENTHLYISRLDTNLDYYKAAIHWKKR